MVERLSERKTLFIKPREGGLVRRPDNGFKPLKADGERVPALPYYLKRLKDGDVIEVDEKAPKKSAKKPAKADEADESKQQSNSEE